MKTNNFDLSNKENSQNHQNTSLGLFSNPFINQKLSPKLNTEQSYDSSNQEQCPKHSRTYQNLFCVQCLSYTLCSKCIPENHAQHEVMHFPCKEDLISGTRETILESLEETLKHLKSRENEVKNRAHQIDLVKNSLKLLQEEIVQIISGIFKQIQGRLGNTLAQNTMSYEQQVDNFFEEFNRTNDDLRENLMQIIDGEIDIKTFDKSMVIKSAPRLPEFQKFRIQLQKIKKVYRDVKNQLGKTKIILQSGCDAVSKQSICQVNQSMLTKFDKYIENSQKKGEKVNQSFMKTLKLLGTNNSNELSLMKLNLSRRSEKVNEKRII